MSPMHRPLGAERALCANFDGDTAYARLLNEAVALVCKSRLLGRAPEETL